MTNLLVRLIINALALWVAAYLLGGIHLSENIVDILLVALVFGLINALLKPIVRFFTCPLYVLTLGLFTFIVNALMLYLTSAMTDPRLQIDSVMDALLGGIIISIVSFILSMAFGDKDDQNKRRGRQER